MEQQNVETLKVFTKPLYITRLLVPYGRYSLFILKRSLQVVDIVRKLRDWSISLCIFFYATIQVYLDRPLGMQYHVVSTERTRNLDLSITANNTCLGLTFPFHASVTRICMVPWWLNYKSQVIFRNKTHQIYIDAINNILYLSVHFGYHILQLNDVFYKISRCKVDAIVYCGFPLILIIKSTPLEQKHKTTTGFIFQNQLELYLLYSAL